MCYPCAAATTIARVPLARACACARGVVLRQRLPRLRRACPPRAWGVPPLRGVAPRADRAQPLPRAQAAGPRRLRGHVRALAVCPPPPGLRPSASVRVRAI
eukprot:6213295-Pleurochrysis_carterae.AAC.1